MNNKPATDSAAAQSSSGKISKNLRLPVIYVFIPLALIIIGLVYYVASNKKIEIDPLSAEQAAAFRIQKIGTIALREANRTLKSGEEVFKTQCTNCHSAGLIGAPKFGDAGAWAPRIKTGYTALLTSALKGKNAMPPQGGQLNELEIGRAVVYMANAAGAKFAEPKDQTSK